MNYTPLPAKLSIGDRIACPRCEPFNPEVLEVLKVYDDGRLLLCRENGLRVTTEYTRDDLARYDYEIVTETTN